MLFEKTPLSAAEIELITTGKNADAVAETAMEDGALALYLTADVTPVRFVRLTWRLQTDPALLVLRDAWERSYADLGFVPVGENTRALPWYFLLTDGKNSAGFGVRVRPNAFVSFRLTPESLTALVDCRAGGVGVELEGRRLRLCEFVFGDYPAAAPFDALTAFCRLMCPLPARLPDFPVFGTNDWYYAYGHNTPAQVLRDAETLVAQSADQTVRPFTVMDDGWQQNGCAAPWLPSEAYADMAEMARKIRNAGARPGLWFRPLSAPPETDPAMLLRRGDRVCLDPSHPGTRALLRMDLRRFRAWGYELIKHDFSSYDLFGAWGKDMADTVTEEDGWSFYDRSHTGAETVLSFYRLIREETPGVLLIACNAFSHLTAGLTDLYRTGDDTSGRDWARTRDMGVNTLAFRLPQHGIFYLVDADCVGDADGTEPWEKNRQWLALLSQSNTALFTSVPHPTDEQTEDLRRAYAAVLRRHTLRPVDLMTNKTPAVWEIDGETVRFDWD